MRLKPILKIILSLNLCQTDFFQSFKGIIPSDYLSLNVQYICARIEGFALYNIYLSVCVIAIINHYMWLFLQMVCFHVLANFILASSSLLGRMTVEIRVRN